MTVRVKYADKTAAANGLKLHYLEWGDPSAPMLIALHGQPPHHCGHRARRRPTGRRHVQRGHAEM